MTGAESAVIRRSLGLSQPQLAERLGVHPMTISRRERDELAIRPETALALRALVETAGSPA